MAATAELKRSLYAAQEAWRPIMRRPTKDKAARNIMMFGEKAMRTKPSTKASIAQVARIARKAPQTMVKVSKATYGASHTFSNFTYIARNGKVPMFDQDGVEIGDVSEMRELADEWRALNYDPAELDSRHASPDARRLILSMPRGTDPDIVLQAARATARQLFEDNFDYVYALHTDEGKGKSPNPHVHLTIRAQGHDGTKLAFGPDDLHYMRRVFAAELRERGVDADATPQIARGPRFNNEHSKTYQARLNVEENNNDRAKPRRSFERDNRRMEAGEDREYISADIVGIYADLMLELAKSRDPEFQELGREFGKFVDFNFKARIETDGPTIVASEKKNPLTIDSPPPKRPKI
ncbi:MAG: hypothetical protein ABJA20_01445 [Novosphingobium sp.]